MGDMRGGAADDDSLSASQSMSEDGSSEGDFGEDSGEVSLGSGGDDDSLLSETGEDESEFTDEGSEGSGSVEFSDSDDEGF